MINARPSPNFHDARDILDHRPELRRVRIRHLDPLSLGPVSQVESNRRGTDQSVETAVMQWSVAF